MIGKRELGSNGPSVGCLGYGAMVLEGYYGASDDAQAIGTIRRALDVGMNMIDTADAYGNGHNEMLVGRAIAGMRQQAFVATKFGIVFDENESATDLPTGWGFSLKINGRPAYVRKALYSSLRRLAVDRRRSSRIRATRSSGSRPCTTMSSARSFSCVTFILKRVQSGIAMSSMRRKPFSPIAALAALVVLPSFAGAQERPATHLVTHNEVTIARPASAIWPYIVDPSAWKQGNKLAHRAGPVGGVGEVFAAVNAESPDKTDYFVQNVELDPNRRRTIKLVSPDDVLIGFATFELREQGGTTVVRYDVYAESRVPDVQAKTMSPQAMAAAERAAIRANGARFQAELEGLKKLVEGR